MGSTVESRTAALKAAFGGQASSLFPGTFYIALLKAGAEPDSSGNYARVAKLNNAALWTDPAFNVPNQRWEVATKVEILFPVATALYSLEGLDGWGIYDNASGGALWWSGTFETPVTISGVGDQIRIPPGLLTIGQG